MNSYPSVPVLMFHMVTDDGKNTPLPWLATPIWRMEYYLSYLQKENYTTITLHELYEYLNEGKPISERSIVLTFDDGYLDNWVNAYPLLKKYGMKGVVWASSDFIMRSSVVHPNTEDRKATGTDIQPPRVHGYLSEGELQAMERSGVFEVGVHCKTHTRIFSSHNIVDFQHPGANYYWLSWNRNPECRLSWLTDSVNHLVPFGTPIYENGLATCTRQYFPDPRLETILLDYVAEVGGVSFFSLGNWKSILLKQVNEWHEKNEDQGRCETDEELIARLRAEISEPKAYFESVLGHPIDFLCWPGGGSSRLGLKLAKEAGYLATTVRSMPNRYGKRADMINRNIPPFMRNPLLDRIFYRLLFRYLLGRIEGRFPYFQLWYIQHSFRRNVQTGAVQLCNDEI